ncbi:microviridin/marinostatin family tricyclic proteinase inhibitor [Chitinophaga sp. XS-30]|uniref:microviridin/marinostatin family tricyclic proteinase inhibitor n=1 Tax=Chitinophaga sp. XS-30 TaxID=2604421 RepID=UPI0011DD7250|nr:microviridin/marinostatin family tricyclic proteinase inhibitor [Chitinophaga sp. XS-30]QEH43168.1 microviridin/marinostatin family tricyclic proteinase inhibitor [Chitinophaga sp. XS-30]
MKPNEQVLKPFFAQFLETQMKPEEAKKRSTESNWTSKLADAPDQTQKYPSDGDEEWWLL